MHAPRIQPLQNNHPALKHLHGYQAFEISADGDFLGRRWHKGEIALCDSDMRDGDAVVLVPRGMGRARLGFVMGATLVGDRGEPCAKVRWMPVGRINAIVRPASVGERAVGWIIEDINGKPVIANTPNQLPLFMGEAVTRRGENRRRAA